MEWFRSLVNPLLEDHIKLETLEEIKDWIRKMHRSNKAKNINVDIVQDPLLVDIYKFVRVKCAISRT